MRRSKVDHAFRRSRTDRDRIGTIGDRSCVCPTSAVPSRKGLVAIIEGQMSARVIAKLAPSDQLVQERLGVPTHTPPTFALSSPLRENPVPGSPLTPHQFREKLGGPRCDQNEGTVKGRSWHRRPDGFGNQRIYQFRPAEYLEDSVCFTLSSSERPRWTE